MEHPLPRLTTIAAAFSATLPLGFIAERLRTRQAMRLALAAAIQRFVAARARGAQPGRSARRTGGCTVQNGRSVRVDSTTTR